METIKKTNDALKGFRGLLTILVTYLGMWIETSIGALSGASPEAVKVAFVGSIPITLKLVYTDAWPRILEIIKGKKDDQLP